MRPPVSHPRMLEHARCSRRLAMGVRAIGLVWLLGCLSGCGVFGSGQQLKQLQMENDRLLSEYRAQRDRVAKLQETNAALEARVGEAERLLAQAGKTLPSSRISRAPQRGSAASGTTPPDAPASQSGPGSQSGSASPTAPPYIPPSVPSLPGTAGDQPASGDVQWRPMRRQ